MLVWWGVLFALGILAFLDGYLGFGELFRQVNAAIFLLALLGLLIRIVRKTRQQTKEQFAERIAELESALQATKGSDKGIAARPDVTADQAVAV